MNPLMKKYLEEMAMGGAQMPPAWEQGATVEPEPHQTPADLMAYFRAMKPELFSQESIAGAQAEDAETNARNAGLRRMESGAAGFGLRAPNYAGMEPSDQAVRGLGQRQEQAFRSAEVGSKVGGMMQAQDASSPTSKASFDAYAAAMSDPEIAERVQKVGRLGQVSAAQIAQIKSTGKEGAGIYKDRGAGASSFASAGKAGEEATTERETRPEVVRGKKLGADKIAVEIPGVRASTAETEARTRKLGVETAGLAANPPGKAKTTEAEAALRKELAGTPAGSALAIVAPLNKIMQGTSPDGPGDMSMLYAFMKMIDPGSAVREGEYATAANSGGIPDTVRVAYNRALQGDKLSDDLRTRFRAEGAKIYAERYAAYDAEAKAYRGLAEGQGVDPGRVVIDRGYAAPGASAGENAAEGPVRVKTPAEAMALPPGTVFITPDGQRKVRP